MSGFTKRIDALRERAVRVEKKRGAGAVGVLFFDGNAWWLNDKSFDTEDAAMDAFDGDVLILADI